MMRLPPWLIVGYCLLAGAFVALFLAVLPALTGAADIWYLPIIGAFGAIIANSTGTGGGVVFIPVFNILRESGGYALTPLQVLALSFIIQSFGMSMGALRWTAKLSSEAVAERVFARDYWATVLLVLALALPVMLLSQRFFTPEPQLMLFAFKGFSILLGCLLLFTTLSNKKGRALRRKLEPVDMLALAIIAIPAGFANAIFSIGIGELVALWLFMRQYPVLLSAGAACVISAISAIAGSFWHVAADTIPWDAAALAIPGALLGAFVARPLALWLGSFRLKLLASLWIVFSGLYLLIL